MSEETRRSAFAVVVLVVGVVVVGLVLLGGAVDDEGEPAPAVGSQRTRPVILGASPEPERQEGRTEAAPRERTQHAATSREAALAEDLTPDDRPPARSARLRREAQARAREFLDAFLLLEVDDSSPLARGTIERLADPELAQLLLTREPGATAGDPAPKVARVDELASELLGPTSAVITATITRAKRRSAMLLRLRRGPSGWLVTDLG